MEIKFTEATQHDVPGLLQMMEEFNALSNYPFDSATTRENLEEFLGDKRLGRIWIIRSENLAVGYVVLAFGFSFEYRGHDAFIDELFLKDGYRNKGIGGMAMEFVEAEVVKLGIRALHLEVEHNNEKASRLYIKQGYRSNDRLLLTKRL